MKGVLPQLTAMLCITLLSPPVHSVRRGQPAQTSEAKECYLRILKLADATTDNVERITLLTGLAEISADYGRRDEALRFLTRARAIDLPEAPARNAMKRLVIAACAKLRLFDEALTIAGKIPESRDRAWEFITLAEAMRDAGLKDEARSALSRALDADRSLKGELSVLLAISRAYAALGEFDTAKQLAAKMADPSDKVEAIAYIAVEFVKAGQQDRAKALLSPALRAGLPSKPKPGVYSTVADACGEAGLKDEAAQLLTRAEGMTRPGPRRGSQIESQSGLDYAINRIVGSYARLGQIAKARSLANMITFVPDKADSLIDIARACFKAGDAKLGTALLEESCDLAKNESDERINIGRLIDIADAFLHSGQKKRAGEVLNYGLNRVRRSEPHGIEEMIDLIKAYARLGITLDDEACGLLDKIVNGEPVPLTPRRVGNANSGRAGG